MKMAGMMITKTDSKAGINAQVKVRAPFAVINTDGILEKEKFDTDMEGFVSLYERLTNGFVERVEDNAVFVRLSLEASA
jgi:hypothetical protein